MLDRFHKCFERALVVKKGRAGRHLFSEKENKGFCKSSIDFDVIETSDDGDTTDDNTTADTYISPNPSIEVVKTFTVSDDNPDGQTGEGDTITYTIVVENTGNVTLTSITLDDTLTDHNGNALSLDSGPTFVSANAGSPGGTLSAGETATYTASYTIGSSAAYSGSVRNRVVVTSSSPGNTGDVIDISDNGNDNDMMVIMAPTHPCV